MGEALLQFFWIILTAMGTLAVLATVGLVLVARSLRNIRVPPGADFFATMHYVPISLVVLLDLLDLALDVFSAPISWLVLDRMGLSSLRNIAAVEGLLPLTGPIPTLTLSWLLARFLGLGSFEGYGAQAAHPAPPRGGYLEDERYDDGVYAYETRRRRRRPVIIDVDEVDEFDEFDERRR
jgi:hypothetical protein